MNLHLVEHPHKIPNFIVSSITAFAFGCPVLTQATYSKCEIMYAPFCSITILNCAKLLMNKIVRSSFKADFRS